MTLLPATLNVEITTRCNAQCRICARRWWGSGRGRPVADMSSALCKRLLDVPGLEKVSFGLYGEPLLWPPLADMVARASQKGLYSWITTNAALLSRERAAALFDAGLSKIICSVDALDAKTYADLRPPLRYDAVTAAIEGALALRDRDRYATRIVVNMTVTKESGLAGREDEARARWAAADGVALTREGDVSPPASPLYANMDPVSCERPMRQLTVLVDGSLSLCCRDAHGVYTFGSVATGFADPLALYNGVPFAAVRNAMSTGIRAPTICRGCRTHRPGARPPVRAP